MLATRVLGEADTRSVVEALLTAGQDVQLHLHPVYWYYRRFLDGGAGDRDHYRAAACDQLCAHSPERQLAMLEEASELFQLCTGRAPVAFRAGNFAASRATLRALGKLGFLIDSSYNPAQRDDPSLADDPPEPNVVQSIEGVGSSRSRWPAPGSAGQRPSCRPDGPLLGDGADLDTAHAAAMPHVTLLFHSRTFSEALGHDLLPLPAEPYRPAAAAGLLRFLDANRDRFQVQTFGNWRPVPSRPPDGGHPR
jgi:hypothetical protein